MSNKKISQLKKLLPPLHDLIPEKIDKTTEFAGPCPKCGGTDRFFWKKDSNSGYCRQCEQNADNLDIIIQQTGKTIPELLVDYGIETEKKKKKRTGSKKSARVIEKHIDDKTRRIKYIWKKAKQSPEHISRYLNARNIDPVQAKGSPALRWSSYTDNTGQQVTRIIAAVSNINTDKAVQCVHRIWIDTEDYKKQQAKILGDPKGRGCWFFRDASKKAESIMIGEGIETTLAAYTAAQKHVPELAEVSPVAAISSSLLKIIDIPQSTKNLYILVDEDSNLDTKTMAGQRAAYALAQKFCDAGGGHTAYLVTPTDVTFSPSPGQIDFNDLDENEIVKRFEAAINFHDLEWTPEMQKETHVGTDIDDTNDAGNLPVKTVKALHEMNKRYAACLLGGKFRIIREGHDEIANRKKIDFLNIDAFRLYHKNKRAVVPDGEDAYKVVDLSSVWLAWDNRRTYHTITFQPQPYGNEKSLGDGIYNLFSGWPIKPKKGSWQLMQRHILEVLCQGNDDHYRYMLDWMARILQDTGGERPGVAVVFKGGKGIGKGALAQYFGALFGDAFLPISDSSKFTGRFNMHLSKTVLVFLDEAIWGGNKRDEGNLKALITEPAILFEPKGIDSMALPNHLNVLIASNEDWVVPATGDERRFFVLTPSDKRRGDVKYFGALFSEMRNGGPAAMMYDLLRRKITVDLRSAPKTEGLRRQIEESMTPVQNFWADVMSRGYLLSDQYTGSPRKTEYAGPTSDDMWPEMCYKHEVYAEFINFCKNHGIRHFENNQWFWLRTWQFWPGGKPRRLKTKIIGTGDNGNVMRGIPIVIPGLDDMRYAFRKVHLAGVSGSDDDDSVDHQEEGFSVFDGQF